MEGPLRAGFGSKGLGEEENDSLQGAAFLAVLFLQLSIK